MKKLAAIFLLSTALAALAPSSQTHAASGNPIAVTKFQSGSNLKVSETEIQKTWTALKALGTTQFVGGMIGNFKLDESSMIAGALAIGVTEFDNFLRSGSLSSSSSNLSSLLSSSMGGAAGIDMSYLTGSFTAGGGSATGLPFSTSSSLSSTAGGAVASGQCDPSVAAKQVAVGLQGVKNVVDSALTDSFGFSQNKALGGSNEPAGFASRGCLDKLFQNAGSDILFKPPSLGSLTSMMSSWSCDKAVSVADQVNGQFGDMSSLNTTNMGGFFPSGVFGEANEGVSEVRPGIGNDLTEVFGNTFNETTKASDPKLSTMASVFGN